MEGNAFVTRAAEMFGKALHSVFGDRNERYVRSIKTIVQKIADLEPELEKLSDSDLQAKTGEFRLRLNDGQSLDHILPEAFAVVREASRRTLGMRHYDVQMLGGILLHRGIVTEMMTGEGKTLMATCPAYLNAISGHGVHIITVNDFLAQRDSEWMGAIYKFLGLSVGCILSSMEDPEVKRSNYGCDITYGTNNEFGFDYLRDNMKVHRDELVQRELNYAIVDEVDSILIDEARTPLIISGPAEMSDDKYIRCNKVGKALIKDTHFTIDEKETSITLTDEGVKASEDALGVEHLFSGENMDLPHYINNALRAHHLFKKDRDYVVQKGEVVIVDEHTGRLMQGRRWSDGLHQAVEVKESLPLKRESQTLATITFQNLFRLYNKLAGMTGTAMTEANEFLKIYKLDVVAVPPNRPCVREDLPDEIYGTEREKYEAIVANIRERHAKGQPILVGTASIESSEKLSRMLNAEGIVHEVLNAKQHKREAGIVAQAGRIGALTVSTNMAGRGTDIVLGGNVEAMARENLGKNASEEEVQAEVKRLKPTFAEEQAKVKELGGLFVLGTERHDARRIDNQLRGRAGRQGDPGGSQFYLSLEDTLMRRFAPPWVARIMQKTGLSDGEPIAHPMINKSIANAQKRVEEFNFDIRKNLLEYDEVMNEQRKYIYRLRNRILYGEQVSELLKEWVSEGVSDRVSSYRSDSVLSETPDEVEQELRKWAQGSFGQDIELESPLANYEEAAVRQSLMEAFEKAYAIKQERLGEKSMEFIETYLLLNTIDHQWKEHLYGMDILRDSIGYRSYAQMDPKIEYKKEGYNMFSDMLYNMKLQVTGMAVPLNLVNEAEMESVYEEDRAIHADANSTAQTPSQDGEQGAQPEAEPEPEITKPIVNTVKKVGRNDPCPCGSGKKYKSCHGK
jgi:preprotein translocase subunit SecA